MKILTDQDVYATTLRFLRGLGHDVVAASAVGLTQAADTELLSFARDKERIFVTRDRDFGSLVFVHGLIGGVIYLRMNPSTADAVHDELSNVLECYTENELRNAFVVVEQGRHRFRKLLQEQGAK